jgi:hypothetical protein
MAADVLLGDEMRWNWLYQHGTANFFESHHPRIFALSRLELDDVDSCCAVNIHWVCHDMFMFKAPLHNNVRLDLFNYQQNIWQGENYAVGLLRAGGYELFNPCYSLPLFHNHNSGQRPNQNENRCAPPTHFDCVNLPPNPLMTSVGSIFEIRKHDRHFSSCYPQKTLEAQCSEKSVLDGT